MKNLKTSVTISLLILFFHGIRVQAQTTRVIVLTIPAKVYALELWVYNLNDDVYEFGEKLDLDSNGRVNFQISEEPNLYQIKLGNNGIEFVNDRDSLIEIVIDMKTDVFPPITVKGSEATDLYTGYLLKVAELQKKYLYPLESKMKAALKSKDQNRLEAVELEHQENLKIFTSILAVDIKMMGSSLALFAVIRTLDFNKYLDFIETREKIFVADRPDSPFSVKLKLLVQEAKRIQIGELAPEFELMRNYNNRMQQLSSFRGGVVLIDFWASWCLPCIKENLEFKEIYAKHNADGFNIWGVSIDKKEKAWKKSLNKYNLPWVQSRSVDDQVINMYNVQALPTNFLLDENGRIIARNITAKELSNILGKIYE